MAGIYWGGGGGGLWFAGLRYGVVGGGGRGGGALITKVLYCTQYCLCTMYMMSMLLDWIQYILIPSQSLQFLRLYLLSRLLKGCQRISKVVVLTTFVRHNTTFISRTTL